MVYVRLNTTKGIQKVVQSKKFLDICTKLMIGVGLVLSFFLYQCVYMRLSQISIQAWYGSIYHANTFTPTKRLSQILTWVYKVPLTILRYPPNINIWLGWQFWYPWIRPLIPMGRFFDTIELLLIIDSTMHSRINIQIQHWWIMMTSRAHVQYSATNIWVLDNRLKLWQEKMKNLLLC